MNGVLELEQLKSNNPCIFLDSAFQGWGMLFSDPLLEIVAFNKKEFFDSLSQIDKIKKTKYVVGYIRYEAKEFFLQKEIESNTPLLWFGMFDKYELIEKINHDGTYNPFIKINNDIPFEEYKQSFSKIKSQIELGNTYQVNYTFDKILDVGSSVENLYLSLRETQKTDYLAFIKNKYDTILSFSPELFFEIYGNKIKVKPMKGTIQKGKDELENQEKKNFLKNDEKNKAENSMIVDLLRNDIGRLCKLGSVNVASFLEIEEYSTLYQMTSTVEGELKPNVSILDILTAIFPCGSVTGAPKIKTMNIIQELEKGLRGVYCGAIGYLSPEKSVFSVPIRILQKQNNHWQYRVGSGIVWDSDLKEEWKECELKAKFLESQINFGLIETMLVLPSGRIFYEKRHFDRLKSSAEYFGFVLPAKIFPIRPLQTSCILRLVVYKDGRYDLSYRPILDSKTNLVQISQTRLDSQNTFLFHKTTYRPWYEDAMQKISARKYYDVLFFNEKGELCEGARSNVLLEKNGIFYTPKVESGLLNGIFRQRFMQKLNTIEKSITYEELKDADAVYCMNSVRGLKEVRIAFG